MLHQLKTSLFLAFSMIISIGCSSEEEERQENITKPRAIGISTSLGVQTFDATSFGSQLSNPITFYFLVPKDWENPTIENQELEATSLGVFPQIAVEDAGSIQETALGPIKLLSITLNSSYTLPEQLKQASMAADFISLSLAKKFTFGEEQEIVTGKVILYNKSLNAAVADWKPPVLSLASPTLNQEFPGGEGELKAELVAQATEEYKIGWFASSGKIVNRRALNTKISEAAAGEQSLVVTARGRKTGSFSIQTQVVKVP